MLRTALLLLLVLMVPTLAFAEADVEPDATTVEKNASTVISITEEQEALLKDQMLEYALVYSRINGLNDRLQQVTAKITDEAVRKTEEEINKRIAASLGPAIQPSVKRVVFAVKYTLGEEVNNLVAQAQIASPVSLAFKFYPSEADAKAGKPPIKAVQVVLHVKVDEEKKTEEYSISLNNIELK